MKQFWLFECVFLLCRNFIHNSHICMVWFPRELLFCGVIMIFFLWIFCHNCHKQIVWYFHEILRCAHSNEIIGNKFFHIFHNYVASFYHEHLLHALPVRTSLLENVSLQFPKVQTNHCAIFEGTVQQKIVPR